MGVFCLPVVMLVKHCQVKTEAPVKVLCLDCITTQAAMWVMQQRHALLGTP